MPTTLASPSNTQVKVRYNEPFTSAALNQKSVGPIPSGVVRGGLLITAGAGFNVTINPDPVTGDSVYTYTTALGGASVFQLNYRENGARTLDLSAEAGNTVYIALFVDYSIGSTTSVEWRAYTEAELFGGAPVAEAGSVVIVGRVVVPGGGPIAASAVTPEGKTVAFFDGSKGVRQWKNIVKNGDFAAGVTTGGGAGSKAPYWSTVQTGLPTLYEVTTTNPRSGLYSYEFMETGTGTATLYQAATQSGEAITPDAIVAVRAGQLIQASFYLAGLTVPAYTNGVGGCILQMTFVDETGATIGTETVESDVATEVGTFAYTRLSKMVEAPGDGFFYWNILFSFDLGGGPGSFYVDDVAIYVEPVGGTVEEASEPVISEALVLANGIGLTPRADVGSQAQKIQFTPHLTNDTVDVTSDFRPKLTLDNPYGNAPYVDADALWLKGFDVDAIDLSSSGVGLLGTNKSGSDDTAPTDYKLLHRYRASSSVFTRVYTQVTGGGHIITRNARWLAASSEWFGDTTGQDAFKMTLNGTGLIMERKQATLPGGGWLDSAWDDNLLSSTTHSIDAGVLGALLTTSDVSTGGNDYSLLFEFQCESGNAQKARIYVGQDFRRGIFITLNAQWDGALWSADDTAFTATYFGLNDFEIQCKRKATTAAPWANTAWDPTTPGVAQGPGGEDLVLEGSGRYAWSSPQLWLTNINMARGNPYAQIETSIGAGGTLAFLPTWTLSLTPPYVWTARLTVDQDPLVFPLTLPDEAELDRIRVILNPGAARPTVADRMKVELVANVISYGGVGSVTPVVIADATDDGTTNQQVVSITAPGGGSGPFPITLDKNNTYDIVITSGATAGGVDTLLAVEVRGSYGRMTEPVG